MRQSFVKRLVLCISLGSVVLTSNGQSPQDRELRTRAAAGHAEAQVELARRYVAMGDDSSATRWASHSARDGYRPALALLRELTSRLPEFRVGVDELNLRRTPVRDSQVVIALARGQLVYLLELPADDRPPADWAYVYDGTSHQLGYVPRFLIVDNTRPRPGTSPGADSRTAPPSPVWLGATAQTDPVEQRPDAPAVDASTAADSAALTGQRRDQAVPIPAAVLPESLIAVSGSQPAAEEPPQPQPDRPRIDEVPPPAPEFRLAGENLELPAAPPEVAASAVEVPPPEVAASAVEVPPAEFGRAAPGAPAAAPPAETATPETPEVAAPPESPMPSEPPAFAAEPETGPAAEIPSAAGDASDSAPDEPPLATTDPETDGRPAQTPAAEIAAVSEPTVSIAPEPAKPRLVEPVEVPEIVIDDAPVPPTLDAPEIEEAQPAPEPALRTALSKSAEPAVDMGRWRLGRTAEGVVADVSSSDTEMTLGVELVASACTIRELHARLPFDAGGIDLSEGGPFRIVFSFDGRGGSTLPAELSVEEGRLVFSARRDALDSGDFDLVLDDMANASQLLGSFFLWGDTPVIIAHFPVAGFAGASAQAFSRCAVGV